MAVRSPYVIPFGRVLGQSDGDPPLNEVMIGREDERAYFIDLLVSRGPTGSYLVTGRRGVGKSSFVRHCLNEYGAAVFKRFLRSNSAKSFWDLTAMAVFAALVIGLGLLMSDMAKLLLSLPPGSEHHSPLFDVAAIPLVLLCLYPLVFARQLIETTLRNQPPIDASEAPADRGFFSLLFRSRTWVRLEGLGPLLDALQINLSHHAATIAAGITLLIAGIVWLAPAGGAPVLTLGRYFVSLCGLYAYVQLRSYERWESPDGPGSIRQSTREFRIWVFATIFFAAQMGWDLFDQAQWLVERILPETKPLHATNPSWLHVATGFLLLTAGNVARAFHLQRPWQRAHVVFALRDGLFWYVFFAGLGLLTALFCAIRADIPLLRPWDSRTFVLAFLSAFLYLHIRHHVRQERRWRQLDDLESPHFRPRPRMLLALKAVGAVIVALQLGHPGLIQLQSQHVPGIAEIAFGRAMPAGSDAPAYSEEVRLPVALARVPGGGEAVSQNLFQLRLEEVWWGCLLFLTIVMFYVMEYEWVVRPFMPARDERSLDPARRPPWEDQQRTDIQPHQRFQYRQMERLTFPWMAYATLLPTISITVNLGFDRLDHRSVIHAMLMGLRNEYHRQFLSWHSGTANVIRLLSLLLLVLFGAQLGEAWFALPGNVRDKDAGWQQEYFRTAIETWTGERYARESQAEHKGGSPTVNPLTLTYRRHLEDRDDRTCQFYDAMHKWELDKARRRLAAEEPAADPGRALREAGDFETRPGLQLLCNMWHSDFWVSVMYFDLIRINGVSEADWRNTALAIVVGTATGLPIDAGQPFVALRGYHVVLGAVLLLIGRWVMFWLPLLPYRRNLSRIDDLLDSLSARTVHRRASWKPAQWIRLVFGDDQPSEVEHAPADSRTTELAFMEILRDLQSGSVALLDGSMQRISIPAPEITFVFDELDKLGANLDAEQSPMADSPEDLDLMGAERRRSLALHRLMSDLKQILSAAPARFIFVGSRQLHDEWLADQTSRQPLLTSIFNAEVYLPSLLTDHGQAHVLRQPMSQRLALHDRVAEYLARQHWRASQNMTFWTSMRWRPTAGLMLRRDEPGAFFQPAAVTDSRTAEAHLQRLRVIDPLDVPPLDTGCHPWKDEFLLAFVHFLTYRSAGNPKRLRELMLGFQEPVGRVIADDVRWTTQSLACHDVLYFNDDDIFRIQLLDHVYRSLVDRFGSRLVRRDDKIAVSLFFVADFLFKFHLRAFAWGNLERIEELVHIHRAPDMRLILEELVEHCSDRFLHRVLNGMYTFRFRSDLAREIEYLSRRSEDDLASFNFTLDESQALKRPYLAGLRSAKTANSEVFAGAGELFEFDEEFEMARQHYRTAITLLDEDLERLLGDAGGCTCKPAASPDWSGVGEVLNGSSLGRKLVVPMVSWGLARLRLMLQIGMTYELARNEERAEAEYRSAFVLSEQLLDAYLEYPDLAPPGPPGKKNKEAERFRTTHALKHFVLIYQPVFAMAWIAEKLIGDIDASTAIVKEYIDRLRNKLPFVRERTRIGVLQKGHHSSHSNFALIISELHRKAGDLFFFKGRQAVRAADIGRFPGDRREGPEGFLLRAHVEYIVALHELRRQVQSRMRNSAIHGSASDMQRRTITEGEFPNYIHLAVGNALSDLSDSLLSRVSLFGMLEWMDSPLQVDISDRGRTDDNVTWHLLKCMERCVLLTRREKAAAAGGTPCCDITGYLNNRAGNRSFQDAFIHWFETNAEDANGLPVGMADCEAPAIPVRETISTDDDRRRFTLHLDDLGDWIGHWSCGYCEGKPQDPVVDGEEQRAHERLLVSLSLSTLSAKYFERSGQWTDAAREHAKICETVCTVLWWIAGLRRAPEWSIDLLAPARAANPHRWPEPFVGPSPEPWAGAYLQHLRSRAVEALRAAITAFRNSHLGRDGMNREPSGYLLGGALPPSLLTLACSLYLASNAVGIATGDVVGILAEINGGKRRGTAEDVREELLASIRRNRFPMLNRLNAMQALINAELLQPRPSGEAAEGPGAEVEHLMRADALMRDWLDLLDGYDAPLHFSPLSVGSTLTWFCMALDRMTGAAADAVDYPPQLDSHYRKHRRAAQKHLERGLQMHTMGAAYYEAISNLFYLYDDFNDRHIHYHHAVQMAGTELISVLTAYLGRAEADAREA